MTAPDPSRLVCARCAVPLSPGKVTVSYMGSSFEVELPRCPRCLRAFVPEDLALGKMAQVEQALEEK
ncbi:MAG: hypothetical protein F8N37_10720 [Telmatospirillum sp.]|nr:hypothetical protein [Telmatospirillum sp.]